MTARIVRTSDTIASPCRPGGLRLSHRDAAERWPDLPGWADAAKRRALVRVAERCLPATAHVAAFARDESVGGPDANRYYDLLWILVDGSGVDVGVDPASATYADSLVDTDPTARLLGGLPPGSLGGDHDRVPGFEAQYGLPRDRVAALVEAALFGPDDPRDPVVRLLAESHDLALGALHAYGRGVANGSRVDDADRTAPRRFGAADPGDSAVPDRPPTVSLFRPSVGGFDPAACVAVLSDGRRAALVVDDDPDVDAVVEALDRVDGDPTVETVVLRGSEPYDHPSVRDRDDYRPRDTFSQVAWSGAVDLSAADVVIEDVQAARENARALAEAVDRGNRLYAMRGRFYDDDPLAAALDRVDDRAERDVRAATTRLWKRDEAATLGGRAAVVFAGGFRDGEPDGRRALGLVAGESALLLPGDATAYDVTMDSGRDWDVVDCRDAREAGLAGDGERPDGSAATLVGGPLAGATPILRGADAALSAPDDRSFVVGDGPLLVTLGAEPRVESPGRSAGRGLDP